MKFLSDATRHNLNAQLVKLEALTPGDFAIVIRRNELLGNALNTEQLLSELAEEVRMKNIGETRGIGFTATLLVDQ